MNIGKIASLPKSASLTFALAVILSFLSVALPKSISSAGGLLAAQAGYPIQFVSQNLTSYDHPLPYTYNFESPWENPTSLHLFPFLEDVTFFWLVILTIILLTHMKKMETQQLVIDECDGKDTTGIFSLTAIMIPNSKQSLIRDDLNRFMRDIENPPNNYVTLSPELHGSSMLKNVAWATDSHRLKCYEKVVDIINKYELHVFRVAYFSKSVTEVMPNSLHGLCMIGLLAVTTDFRKDCLIQPVVDGFNNVLHYAIHIPVLDSQRLRLREKMLTLKGGAQLLEPVFVDSKYSLMMQLADVISYLLHILDHENLPKVSDSKKTLMPIAKRVNPNLLHASPPIEMQMN